MQRSLDERKLKQLETFARKEAIVKDAPDIRVRRRSQKLKDIAHQAKCVNNSLEKRAEVSLPFRHFLEYLFFSVTMPQSFLE